MLCCLSLPPGGSRGSLGRFLGHQRSRVAASGRAQQAIYGLRSTAEVAPGPLAQAVRRRCSAVRSSAQQQASGGGRIQSLSSEDFDDPNPFLAYEVLQGPLVRWTQPGVGITPPTAVLIHGILGSRRNMQSFARMLLEGLPAWQVLMVDLRCHGETASLAAAPEGPHTVMAAAGDVLALLRNLKLFPHSLIGHSFGGKVVMGMVQQFGPRLPRPVQVWVLDSLPGEVRSGEGGYGDHPAELIEALRSMPLPIAERSNVVEALTQAGFSKAIAQWAATNLRPVDKGLGAALSWTFDLDGIKEMYESYELANMLPVLEQPPQGLKLDFVKAEHSNFAWGGEDEQYIKTCGHDVHLLKDSSHWVHTDNPRGLLEIMASSFGHVDLRQPRPYNA